MSTVLQNRPKHGYKGRETALNGLLNWINSNYEFDGSSNKIFKECCSLIVLYGEKNIPGFKKKGHLEVAADYVAKKIQKNNKFPAFTNWLETYITNLKK